MGKRVLALALAIFCVGSSAKGQVSISPEAGISYFPFTIVTASTGQRHSNNLSYIAGVSGSVPVRQNWHLSLRVSYSARENVEWTELLVCHNITTYTHNDLNLDASAHYQASRLLSFWAGPSIIKKLDSYYTVRIPSSSCSAPYSSDRRLNRFIYGVNSGIGFNIRSLVIKAEYFYLITDELLGSFDILGRQRYNLVLAHPVFQTRRNR
jgi:hypothetical protein